MRRIYTRHPHVKAPLYQALEEGDATRVRRLIAEGADVNAVDEVLNSYPLAFAIECGHTEFVPLLLAAGALPNPPEWEEWSALHHAAVLGDTTAVRLLLAAGADIEARNRLGEVPLHFALGHLDTLNTLVESGANPLARDEWENTLLHMATCWDELPVLQRALELVQDVAVRDEFGYTPLHYAARRDNPVALRFLLEAGADINARSDDGTTPLMSAAKEGADAAVEYLLQAGADALLVDAHGWNALHCAAWNACTSLIQPLLQAGIPIDSTTNDGDTPFCLNDSGDWRDEECLACLLQAGATRTPPNEELLRLSKLRGAEKISALLEKWKLADADQDDSVNSSRPHRI